MEIRTATLDQILDLRHRILRAGLPLDSTRFAGDDAATTRHFAAFAPDVIACLTLHLNEWQSQPAYQLRGMAVDAAQQRTGLGRQLLLAAEAFVRTTNVRTLWCNARTPAVPFYTAMGWQPASDTFDIPTAGPHIRMTRTLA